MPGLISNMFRPDDTTAGSSQSTAVDGGTDTGIELSPSVEIATGGSYQNADGSTSEWSNETEIGMNVDVDAALGLAGTVSTDAMDMN